MELVENKWYKKEGSSIATIEKVERFLGIAFPEQYKDFLLWSNGGEGILANSYIYIWAIEDVIAYNKDYEIQKYLQKDYFAFGMDGDVGYIFYLPNYSIYKVGFGDLAIESTTYLAPSLADFLGKTIYTKLNNF